MLKSAICNSTSTLPKSTDDQDNGHSSDQDKTLWPSSSDLCAKLSINFTKAKRFDSYSYAHKQTGKERKTSSNN